MFDSLADLIDGPKPVLAPLVIDPLMARMAEGAGFPALYLGGGGVGYSKTFLEANLSLTEMAQIGVDIGAVTKLPIILDAACGWGDPMHLQRTVALAEAAGFAAIEIEDQHYPKRAGHHVGKDERISQELMEAKIRSAVKARRDPDFLIIARTDVAGGSTKDPEEAVKRSEAYRRAGADVLIPVVGNIGDPEVIVSVGEKLGPPLMFMCPPGGLVYVGLGLDDLHGAGYRIVVDGMSLHMLMYETLRTGYAELAERFEIQPGRSNEDWWKLIGQLHETIDFEALLEAEKNTPEAG